jgi:adiponectin receptor
MSLVNINNVPEWHMANPNIKTGYRRSMPLYDAIKSITQWHNETLNIHTHLLVGLYFLYAFSVILQDSQFQASSPECQYLFYAAYMGASSMGIFSGLAHGLFIVSKEWFTILWKLDFTGIILVNFSHHLLDSFILFKGIIKNTFLCRFAFTLETIFAFWCITRIWNSDLPIGRYWAFVYPIMTSVPLTLPVYAYSMTMLDSGSGSDIIELSYSSLKCTMYIFLAGGLFFKGGFPERYWNPRNIFDRFSSHTWHHIFINCSIFAAFNSLSLLYKM